MSATSVTVIMPTFNSAKFVREALDSVAAQSHRPLQLIVVDDGSSDGTPDIVGRWLTQACASHGFAGSLLCQSHRGGGAARNVGIKNAEGQCIQFLDSDDTLGPGKIAAQVEAIAGAGRTLAYCGWRFLALKGTTFVAGALNQATPIQPEADPLEIHLQGWYCPPHAYLWPRKLLESINGWDPSLAADQDGDLVMRALAEGAQLVYCRDVEVGYRLHGLNQVSRNPSRSKARSRLRVARKIGTLLEARGGLDRYRFSLAARCDELQRANCITYPALAEVCRRTSQSFAPGHRPAIRGGHAYKLVRRIFGLHVAEWFAVRKQAIMPRTRAT